MKKLILSLVLILSFAFTKAQTIDSLYIADSCLHIQDVDKGVTDSVKTATQITFKFFLVKDTSKVEIVYKDLHKVFVVDEIVGNADVGEFTSILYLGTMNGTTYYLGTIFEGKNLFAVTLLSELGDGFMFFITPKIVDGTKSLRIQ